MNKSILTFGVAVLFVLGSITFIGCGSGGEQHESTEKHEHHDNHDDHQHAATYQCPMKCEGDKTYEKAGKCPSCGMNLEEVKEEHDHNEHGQNH